MSISKKSIESGNVKSPDAFLSDRLIDEKSRQDVSNPDLKVSVSGHEVKVEITKSMAHDVVDFHRKFGIEYVGKKRMLPPQLNFFRHERNCEEAKEWYNSQTLAEKLDAGIDQIYIILGTLHLHGFSPDDVRQCWERVHAANMLKERSSPDNPGKYGNPNFCDIVKPNGWVAPNLEDLCQD